MTILIVPPIFEGAERASCRGSDPALFYSVQVDNERAALAICARCPVRAACLQFAVDTKEKLGTWGGQTADQRRRIHRRELKLARGART